MSLGAVVRRAAVMTMMMIVRTLEILIGAFRSGTLPAFHTMRGTNSRNVRQTRDITPAFSL
jgi:hypothetical protein